jgi:hypothetical protein
VKTGEWTVAVWRYIYCIVATWALYNGLQ